MACKQNKEVVAGLIRGALEGEVDLKSIETPVLFLVGEEDVLTPIYLHQRMHQKTKNSKISVIKGGHASLYEFPENIDMHIIPFLKDQSNQLPEHSL